MKPELVCKIEVQKTDGKTCIGSGYPITPNRIITAAHVIADAQPVEGQGSKGIACSSKLFFLGYTWRSEPRVYIEWDGRAAGVDVAVLRCELPDDLRPVHTLQEKRPTSQLHWQAQGYTKYGEENKPSGKDAYRGTMAPIAVSEISFTLECENYPHSSRDWEGGSGSVAFDSPEPKIALAVITDYQGGKKLDQLIAVPICYLLTLEGFRQAIQYDVYAERKKHYDKVHAVVMQQLEKMEVESFLTVARKVAEKVGADSALIDLGKRVKRLLVEECASRILEQQKVTEVVGSLVGLRLSLGRDEFSKLVPIVNHVLPLNYAPHAVQRLREHVSQGRLGFVVGVVTTRTAAELIMAGYDQSPALYIAPDKRKTDDIPGQVALDSPEDPEEGPNLLFRVRNLLYDLVALYDSVLGLENLPARQSPDVQLSPDELKNEILWYAEKLEDAIETTRDLFEDRQLYCVLIPPKSEAHRKARLELLEEIATNWVRNLLFVELVDSKAATDRGEFESESRNENKIRSYLVAQLTHLNQGRLS